MDRTPPRPDPVFLQGTRPLLTKKVYKVRCRRDNRWYAVKEAHHKFRGERDRQQRLQEVAKHERLPPHPHCVRFVKAWEEDYRLYIQTELCRCSLASYAQENHSIPERTVWEYLVDLLLGLKHLHDHNLVHLDVKPENIFIAKEGFCKLGDFGLVLDLTLDDSKDPLEGDPCYLAPEIMEGTFTKAADVFRAVPRVARSDQGDDAAQPEQASDH